MSKKKTTKTFIAIITVDVKPVESFSDTFFGGKKPALNISNTELVEISEPVLIIPSGMRKVEIIPVTSETVIHSKNMKRELRPP